MATAETEGRADVSGGVVGRGVAGLIRVYQAYSATRPQHCRYEPSCSEYTRQAILSHGAVRGMWLCVKRVARCHPWGGEGYDPVPEVRVTSGGRDEGTNA